MPARRKRHPRFDGYVCIVKGCTRVEFKHELCRKHWDEVPRSEKLEILMATIDASIKASRSRDPWLRKWAANYPTGVRAAAGKSRPPKVTP